MLYLYRTKLCITSFVLVSVQSECMAVIKCVLWCVCACVFFVLFLSECMSLMQFKQSREKGTMNVSLNKADLTEKAGKACPLRLTGLSSLWCSL